ncbi:MAG: hypothetical protein JXA90_01325 [Planctomycetes bacterium]|nr:hypothetical protein [Planctomycetota bacterium]
MYAAIALMLVVGFALATVAVPLRYRTLFEPISSRLRSTALCIANQAVFQPEHLTGEQSDRLIRLWLLISAGVFAVLGIVDGTMIRNNPDAIVAVPIYGVVALAGSTLIIVSVAAFLRLIPGMREYATLSRCGFRGLWVLRPSEAPDKLIASFAEKCRKSAVIQILDVTGFDSIANDAGPGHGLLKTILERAPGVPVSVLLLSPQCQEVDPDRQQVTVFQTVLAELELQAATYMQRIRKTLQALDILNEQRSPEAQIEVRFYREKPAFRAVIVDEAALVFPWDPQASKSCLPCLEVSKKSDAPSFYEAYRRSFARIWRNAVSEVFTS